MNPTIFRLGRLGATHQHHSNHRNCHRSHWNRSSAHNCQRGYQTIPLPYQHNCGESAAILWHYETSAFQRSVILVLFRNLCYSSISVAEIILHNFRSTDLCKQRRKRTARNLCCSGGSGNRPKNSRVIFHGYWSTLNVPRINGNAGCATKRPSEICCGLFFNFATNCRIFQKRPMLKGYILEIF